MGFESRFFREKTKGRSKVVAKSRQCVARLLALNNETKIGVYRRLREMGIYQKSYIIQGPIDLKFDVSEIKGVLR
jgi:hypothetical protein